MQEGESLRRRLGFASLLVGAIALVVTTAVALGFVAPSDVNAPARKAGREWKDTSGRVIKRVDSLGRMFLYTWDEDGHLVRIDGIGIKVDPHNPPSSVPGPAVWTHMFEPSDSGVIAEIDCIGNTHRFSTPRKLDLAKGTTLPGHKHVQEAGATPIPRKAGATQFKFDNRGNLERMGPKNQ